MVWMTGEVYLNPEANNNDHENSDEICEHELVNSGLILKFFWDYGHYLTLLGHIAAKFWWF